MAIAHSYLHFNGNCEEAFNHYKSVFGGEFKTVQWYGDMPPEHKTPPTEADKIMHITLELQDGSCLLGGDIPDSFPKATMGNSYYISLHTDTAEETQKIYSGLSEGGKIYMPLEKTFWAPLFGMFADKFGVQWMVSQNENQKQ